MSRPKTAKPARNTCTAAASVEVSQTTLHRYLVAEWKGAVAQFARDNRFAQIASEREAAAARVKLSLDKPELCSAPTMETCAFRGYIGRDE